MGLLIGASALTLIEVFDLLIYNVCRKCANRMKVEPTPPVSTTSIYVSPQSDKQLLTEHT